MSVSQKIVNFLKTGRTLTVAQAQSKFGISNVPARIYDLRENGYPHIYTNTVVKNGKRQSVYRLGTPTKAMRKAARSGALQLAA
jgi:hypothetical protein